MLIAHQGPMGAGKSLDLLVLAYKYEEKGQKVLCFSFEKDTRFGDKRIASRVGLSRECKSFDEKTEFEGLIAKDCVVFVDESQFLTTKQVDSLRKISIVNKQVIHCYGLKSDFRTTLFPGSKRLIEVADVIQELTTICNCGKKAVFNIRLSNGKRDIDGDVIAIGDKEYLSVCPACIYNY